MTAPKTVLDVLIAARELISVPERWTQGDYARDGDGNGVSIAGPDACRWCAVGSIRRSADGYYEAEPAIQALRDRISGELDAAGIQMLIGDWNDSHEHADVLALFDRAIAAERAR